MRVQGLRESDGWSCLGFRTTFRNGWESCLSYAEIIYKYMEQAEIVVAKIAGGTFSPVDIKEIKDIESIPETAVIGVRGKNTIFDKVPFQIIFYNQTDVVNVWIPTQYIKNAKKSETEFFNITSGRIPPLL